MERIGTVGGMIAASVVVFSCGLLAGCSSSRPVGLLQRDGDRAMLQGAPSEAIPYYQEWVERQPQRAEAQHSLGLALLESGRPSEAVGPLTVAWDHEPDNDTYFRDMARSMRESGREASLIGTLRTNATEKGRMIDYLRLGQNLQELGLMDEAHEALKNAAAIDAGQTVKPQLALADFYNRLGRPADEVRRLRMAYSIDPENDEVVGRLLARDVVPGPSLAITPEERP